MDKDFRACAICTSTCFREHEAAAPHQTAPIYPRLPCFLLLSLEVSTNWTPIPREFVEAHGETLRGTARILSANGKEWSVEIGGPGKLLGFKGGWKSFIASMSVKRGDQMLFTLVSKSCFSVYMFNKLGVEVVPAPPVDIKPTITPPGSGKRKRLNPKPEPVSDDENDDDSNDSHMSESEGAESSSESDAETKATVEDEEIQTMPRRRVKREFSGSSRKEETGVREEGILASPATIRKPIHKKRVRATSTTKEGMYIEPGSCTTTFESRRREVTQAELNRTLEAARAMKTEFPSIAVVMMPSHVYRGFWLTIPGKFSKEFMPQVRLEVKLRDVHGFEWPATWIRSETHTGLSGGWAAFSKDHCLEEGDACVFEVINSKHWTIVVHIFRVVEVDLKPGATGGWEKSYNIVHGALMAGASHHKSQSRKKGHATVKRSSSRSSQRCPSKKSTSSRKKTVSGSETSDEEDDYDSGKEDIPPTKLFKEKWGGSDVTSEEVDVKPKIISMRPIPKTTTTAKPEPGGVAAPPVKKVKQEPGVAAVAPGTCGVKREEGAAADVKPSPEELRASLSQASSGVTSAFAVEPEPMPVGAESKSWHRVVRLLGKRERRPESPDHLLEFLVNLGPRVVFSSASCAREDGNGNWWVPRRQFSPDLASCFVD